MELHLHVDAIFPSTGFFFFTSLSHMTRNFASFWYFYYPRHTAVGEVCAFWKQNSENQDTQTALHAAGGFFVSAQPKAPL